MDRGGLFCENDASFHLFRSIEYVTQINLPYHIQCSPSDDNKESLLKTIADDDDVQFHWSMASIDVRDENHSAELLRILVQKWITIRGFGIASLWLEEYKRATKQTTKGKKALRKELSKIV